MTTCHCETCRLHEKLAEALKERDYWRQKAELASSVIERNSLQVNYAEHAQLGVGECSLAAS